MESLLTFYSRYTEYWTLSKNARKMKKKKKGPKKKKLLETLIQIQALKFSLTSLFLSRPFLKKERIGILSSRKVKSWFLYLTKSTLLSLLFRSTHPEVFLGKSVLKMCSKFTEEYPCRSVISIKLQSNCKAAYFQNIFY